MKLKSGYKVTIVGNKCYRCGHVWIPRYTKERSPVCPKCKSPYWHIPKRRKGG